MNKCEVVGWGSCWRETLKGGEIGEAREGVTVPLIARAYSYHPLQRKCAVVAQTYVTVFLCFFNSFMLILFNYIFLYLCFSFVYIILYFVALQTSLQHQFGALCPQTARTFTMLIEIFICFFYIYSLYFVNKISLNWTWVFLSLVGTASSARSNAR